MRFLRFHEESAFLIYFLALPCYVLIQSSYTWSWLSFPFFPPARPQNIDTCQKGDIHHGVALPWSGDGSKHRPRLRSSSQHSTPVLDFFDLQE